MKNSTFLVFALLLAFGLTATVNAQENYDPYKLDGVRTMSYTNDVQPILRAKCMSCHSCYDSPAQLNFTNVLGIQRGAIKLDLYSKRLDSLDFFYVLETTDKTVEDFRDIGFFSVIEGGQDSLMGKMLKLGHQNKWKPNEKISVGIEIDAIKNRIIAPTLKEFIGYENAHPKRGMPYAVAGLTDEEYATMMAWLGQGAKFDAVPPQVTPVEKSEIANWEVFLNKEDNEHRLVARYFYEHMYQMQFFFDEGSDQYFYLVRSKTPSGSEVQPIGTRFVNGGIEGKFYYRFMPTTVEIHHKNHIPLDLTNNRLVRYEKTFFAEPFKCEELPGHSEAERMNPLRTFADIPAKSRYKFILMDPYEHNLTQELGPACRGSLHVSTVLEHEWQVFENPETSLYCNNAEFRKAATPLHDSTHYVTGVASLIRTFQDVNRRTAEYYKLRTDALKKQKGGTMNDIWRGDGSGDTIAYTIARFDDNAGSITGELRGVYPDRITMQNLPILEKKYYSASINYDLFGEIGPEIALRMDFANARFEGVLNYLRFLPAEARPAELDYLYKDGADDDVIKQFLPRSFDLPTGVEFKTKEYRKEFIDQLIAHFGDRVISDDPIQRPKEGDEADEVTKALQKIFQVSEEQYKVGKAGFKAFLGEATLIRIDNGNAVPDFYTMSLNWDIRRLGFTGDIFLRPSRDYDTVAIFHEVMSSYPNFIFDVKPSEMSEFADAFVAADTKEQFVAVVNKWGVRRTSPKFWDTIHSIEDHLKVKYPRTAAFFDVNRYLDY